MAGKQIDFPEKQKHVKSLDMILWAVSIVSIVLVLIAIFVVEGGSV
jgi:uncharacterized membrane protein YvbJ